nr:MULTISPECIES: TadE/TadG family type IV pilus assembly protein [unclassified Crossiella]
MMSREQAQRWRHRRADRGRGDGRQRPAHGRTASRGRIRLLLRGDRGAVSAELVIATPLLLLMLLAIVQFALWSHATHIAQAAASQGLAAARAQNGTAAAGSASAQQMLDQLARGPLTGTSVGADRTANSASIRISGTATSVVPFLSLPVHAEASGPVERFVPDLASGG